MKRHFLAVLYFDPVTNRCIGCAAHDDEPVWLKGSDKQAATYGLYSLPEDYPPLGKTVEELAEYACT